MTELVKGSTELSNTSAVGYAANLLRHYSFELDEFTIDQLLSYWLDSYPVNWIRLATVEALYQGRYKAVSVEQILVLWQRRGQPLYHFNHEFERLVCDKFPRNLLAPNDSEPERQEGVFQKKAPLTSMAGPFQYQTLFQQILPQIHSHPLSIEAVQPTLPCKELAHSPTGDASEANLPGVAVIGEAKEDREEKKDGEDKQLVEEQAPPIEATEILPSPVLESDGKQVTIDETTRRRTLPQKEAASQSQASDFSSESNQSDSVSKSEAAVAPSTLEAVTTSSPDKCPSRQLSVLLFTVENILPGLSLTTPSLKPKLKLELTTFYQPKWLIGEGSKHPIHQFTPVTESSDFCSKLRSVAQSSEEL